MSNLVHHPKRFAAACNAAENALLRWYPQTTLRTIQALREGSPGYPLIHGGSPRIERRAAAAEINDLELELIP